MTQETKKKKEFYALEPKEWLEITKQLRYAEVRVLRALIPHNNGKLTAMATLWSSTYAGGMGNGSI